MAEALLWADFAITRGGAGTIAELALAGLPALLVPLADAAADHQSANADAYARSGAAEWVREADWQDDRVAARLEAILASPERRGAMARAARAGARPDAAAHIVLDCEAMIAPHAEPCHAPLR
jgi:UDP-N-acetylglucosamine--N-acetylmuramyl-(pentapeptide) pyrophosphoryl-undecaprenol N-acetylglucosamine transferase